MTPHTPKPDPFSAVLGPQRGRIDRGRPRSEPSADAPGDATELPLPVYALYRILAEVLVEGGYADGSPESVEARDPQGFRELAEHLRRVLLQMGVEVEKGAIPTLAHDPDDLPGKYVRIP
jgi:hypothetical protein